MIKRYGCFLKIATSLKSTLVVEAQLAEGTAMKIERSLRFLIGT
jgi:hypothetical protein